MQKFLLFALPMEPQNFYKFSVTIDTLVILISIFSYFSDTTVINYTIDLIINLISALFLAILIISLLKYIKGIYN